MRYIEILTALAVSRIAAAIALPSEQSSPYVLHESRENDGGLGSWRRVSRVHPDAIVPVRIGLKQTNLEAGHDILMTISHPESPRYGQHLSMEEVHNLFAPSEEAVESVRSWLLGFDVQDVVQSDNKGWLAINLPASKAEALLQAEFYEYGDSRTGNVRLGCDKYHIPEHIQQHVDYITPGVKLSAPLRKRVDERKINHRSTSTPYSNPTPPHPYPYPSLSPQLQNCAVNITPACYRALYNIPRGHINNPKNAPGVFEQGDYYAQQDLDSFFAEFAPYVPKGTAPVLNGIDGGKAPVAPSDPNNGGEADLDLDIVISLTYPQSVIYYQVDDQIYGPQEVALDNTFNTFLDALDGSYCTYSAYGITGNSPGIDPTYPNPAKGGYKGNLQCGVFKPAQVITASYGEAELDFPKNYVLRQCNEFMKLSLQGHTIMVSSSDFGVGNYANDPHQYQNPNGCVNGFGQNGTIFNPDYPSGCPYILTVGATQLYPNQTVKDRESIMQVNLYRPGRTDNFKYFSSSGGFSNYFKAPSYQAKAVAHYFKYHDPGYKYYSVNANATNIGVNGGRYNRIGRGYPDVSANGANLLVYVNQSLHHYYGTSLAAPIWASVITLASSPLPQSYAINPTLTDIAQKINQERTAAGKGPVGFINPTLYENAWAMNDIVNGTNANCGSNGFPAVEGWEPSGGLGTPNYPKLLKLFMSLP